MRMRSACWVLLVVASAGPAAPVQVTQPSISLAAITIAGRPQQGALVSGTVPAGAHALTLDGQPVAIAPDGAFIIAFGRDAAAASVLRATLADGRETVLPLAVAARGWRVETVGGVPKRPLPDAEFARVRAGELAQINAARGNLVTSSGWRERFRWPAVGRISGLFGSQRIYANAEKGDPHSGVDIAQPTGTPIVAPADGVVVLAAAHPFSLEGNLLIVDHGMGLNSAFLHLSRIDVRVGQVVRQGQLLGAIGATGRASGPHLHWAMKWRDRRIDPLLVAGPMVPGR